MSNKAHTAELKKSFSKTYDEHADAVFRYACHKISDREKAKDVVQETFVKYWEYLAGGGEVKSPRALIYRIASNLIIDHYRRHKESSLDSMMSDDGFDPADHSQAEHMIDASEGALALGLLNKLDESLRDLILLRYVEGLSVKEIAETLDQRENTISVRLHRAIKELRDLFEHNE